MTLQGVFAFCKKAERLATLTTVAYHSAKCTILRLAGNQSVASLHTMDSADAAKVEAGAEISCHSTCMRL
eukprot:1421156-Pleurochrysis_carterae.AAC.2